MTTNVLVSTFAPYSTISLTIPSSSPIKAVRDVLKTRLPSLPIDYLRLSTHGGALPADSTLISKLRGGSVFVTLRLHPTLLGGKGGFGSQLRAAGGRMSSQKTNNNDSCRDLNGRRLSTLKEAKAYVFFLLSFGIASCPLLFMELYLVACADVLL